MSDTASDISTAEGLVVTVSDSSLGDSEALLVGLGYWYRSEVFGETLIDQGILPTFQQSGGTIFVCIFSKPTVTTVAEKGKTPTVFFKLILLRAATLSGQEKIKSWSFFRADVLFSAQLLIHVRRQ